MRFKTWPVAAAALAGLLVLVAVSLLTASRRAQEIYTELDALNQQHREVEAMLRRLRSDVHLSGIFVRDYLLDTVRERAPEYRQRLTDFRRSNLATVARLGELAGGGDGGRMASLHAKVDDYWEGLEPLIDWTPVEKIIRSSSFLRREVLPRREAVLAIAQEIEELNNANLSAQRIEVTRRHAAFRADLYRLLWQSLLLGAFVAIPAVIRLRILERRSEQQQAITAEAERQMRELSQQLVAMQEEERRKLSRELHDHVGQMLTALRLELGRIHRIGAEADTRVAGAVSECRRIVDSIVRTVRNLSLGLRPSMLDDFGLQAALEWHVRELSGRCGVPVDLLVEGDVDRLPDQHRTCVYRVVQEALTNCVRHAGASRIQVTVTGSPNWVALTVADNGEGFDPARRAAGLGLRGIEERVKELRGTFEVASAPLAGTMLRIRVPLSAPEGAYAGTAG